MLKVEKLNERVTYIGALDPDLKIFDTIWETKFGSTYNSYLIDGGGELALLDTAKKKYFDEYFENLQKICDVSKIKYLITNHTEPDHSGEIRKLLEKLPELTIVGTPTALGFLKDITNKSFNFIEVKKGLKLEVGDKTLSFIIAPNLHWPDSMFTYLEQDKILFTCDVFGAHYCTQNVYNDAAENKDDCFEAFKYYFDTIFAPFKYFVRKGLEKIKDLELNLVCPSHGPVIREDISLYKDKLKEWSYEVEEDPDKIAIVYSSAYGFTDVIAQEIKKGIESCGLNVSLTDLLQKGTEEGINEIKSSLGFLIGSPTMNSDAVAPVWKLLLSLNPYDHRGTIAGAFGSYGWSGEAIRNIESRLSMLRCDVYRPGLKIKFNPEDEQEKLKKAFIFGEEFGKKIQKMKKARKGEWMQIMTGVWKCLICGEEFEGEYPPEECPTCGAPADQFIEVKDDVVEYKSDSSERIIVLGSGIAAVSAVDAIRKRNKHAYVEIISDEKSFPYYRILLSKRLCFSDDVENVKDENWFKENNVVLSLGKRVSKIIPNENMIEFDDGNTKDYDKLIIATGAKNNIREIRGDDKEGVFDLRSKGDFERINEFSKRDYVKRVVIIGGGILGIEIASCLRQAGKEVEVVEFCSRIMVRQLDDKAAKLFETHLRNNSVVSHTSETVEEIFGTGEGYKQVCGVMLANSKKTIDCQMVIEATGIKPNIEFAKDSRIETNRGIIVDSHMKTNFDNVFACGDVCEFNKKNIGLWSIALDQGDTAGANAVGDNNVVYHEKPICTSFNGFCYKIFSIGDVGSQKDKEYQVLELSDPKNEVYRKFYFLDNQFVGGVLMGDTKKAVQLRRAIDMGSSLQNFLDDHFLDE